jgi:hypothetical protein
MAKSPDSSKEYIWGKRKSKVWIIIVVAAVVIVAGVAGFFIFNFNANTNTTNAPANQSSGLLIRRAIDGVYAPAKEANRYPVAVMIENLVASRPPSGLAKANLVYGALAEGGITRFMAIYAGQMNISQIGPVRSARPYYLDWALEYNALYVHAGGSSKALADIGTYNVFDLSQFRDPQYFVRDATRQVAIEHTLYTSGASLVYALRDKKAASGSYTTWKFKDESALADRPTTDKNISIDYSSFNYKVEYKYDRQNNEYLRYLAGQIHKDRDGAEIRAKNIVIQKVKTTLADEQHLAIETIGQGAAIVFRDGIAVPGRWEKKSRTDRTLFYAEDGQEITFNAGTTWIEVVPTDRDIVYN